MTSSGEKPFWKNDIANIPILSESHCSEGLGSAGFSPGFSPSFSILHSDLFIMFGALFLLLLFKKILDFSSFCPFSQDLAF